MTMNNRLSSIGQGTDFHRHQPGGMAAMPSDLQSVKLCLVYNVRTDVNINALHKAIGQRHMPITTKPTKDGPRVLAPGLWAFSNTQLTWQNTGRATHVCCVSNMLLASHSMCCIMYKASVPAIALHGPVNKHRWYIKTLISNWICGLNCPFDHLRWAAINVCSPNTWQPNQ